MSWDRLRDAAGRLAPGLRAPLPAGPGCCLVCRGPARDRHAYCFHCAQHRQVAPGLLADVVVPVSYSIAGTGFARVLRRYKAEGGGDPGARTALRLLLLVFLYGHARCLCDRAGHVPAGVTAPSALAVVPSGRGRPGRHPLRELAGSYLTAPWVTLSDAPGEPRLARELHPDRFLAAGPVAGADVLLLDDTWTTGSSAQSAAVALKLGGARSVVILTLGRYLNLSDIGVSDHFAAAVLESSFRTDGCAVHEPAATALISANQLQFTHKTGKRDR